MHRDDMSVMDAITVIEQGSSIKIQKINHSKILARRIMLLIVRHIEIKFHIKCDDMKYIGE